MKKILFAAILALMSTALHAQSRDVVYLKNGSALKGVIIENVINERVKLETADGSIHVIAYSEVVKMERETTAAPAVVIEEQSRPEPEPIDDRTAYRRVGGRTFSDVIGLTRPTMEYKAIHLAFTGEIAYNIYLSKAASGSNLRDDFTGGLGFTVGVLLSQPMTSDARLQLGLAYSMRGMEDEAGDKFRPSYLTVPILLRWYPSRNFFLATGVEADIFLGANATYAATGQTIDNKQLGKIYNGFGANWIFDIGYGPVAFRVRAGMANVWSHRFWNGNFTSKLLSIGLVATF